MQVLFFLCFTSIQIHDHLMKIKKVESINIVTTDEEEHQTKKKSKKKKQDDDDSEEDSKKKKKSKKRAKDDDDDEDEEEKRPLKKSSSAEYEKRKAIEDQYMKKTNEQLKFLMRANMMPVSGNKTEIVDRIVVAKMIGVPQKCPKCEIGNLRYDKAKNMFSCPGGAGEDGKYRRCSFKSKPDGVKRKVFRDDPEAPDLDFVDEEEKEEKKE